VVLTVALAGYLSRPSAPATLAAANAATAAADAVTAAIFSHESPTVQTKARQQELSMALRNPAAQKYADHPWDMQDPEGMPTPDGRLLSAAQFVAEAGTTSPSAPHSVKSIKMADNVMAGGGTMDPNMDKDLESAFATHEDLRVPMPKDVAPSAPVRQAVAQQQPNPWANSAQPGPPVPHSHARAKAMAEGPQGSGAAMQGFTTGSLLRVTPEEFHREMKRYMPSSDGHLVSPYEWFKSIGAPAPVAKPMQ